ncbi:MAG: ABC transporter ATP-binding protein [Pseudomonadota bacterium]|nr:ABC transporter ATP-binding protein [Pseudomonadota bacterium]
MTDIQHKSTWPLLKRLIKSYLKPYVGKLSVSMVFMVMAASMTGLLAYLLEPVIDQVLAAEDRDGMYKVAGMVFAVFAVNGIATYIHTVLMNSIGQGIVADIQHQTYAHLMRADIQFFHENPSGSLIARMISDIDRMRNAVAETVTNVGKNMLTLIFLIVVMFHQDWIMAVGAFVVMPFAASFIVTIGRKLRKVGYRTQEELGTFTSLLSETLQGVRHVKAYGMEEYEQTRIGKVINNLYKLNHKAFRVSAINTPVNETLCGLAVVVVIVFGGGRVIDGAITAGELISFIGAFLLAYGPMKRLAKLNSILQLGLAAAERIFAIIDTEPTIVDKPGAPDLAPDKPEIRLEGVTFNYPDGTCALSEVDIAVAPGKTTALVGASGAGKTTVLNMIPRFYDVSAGTVRVAGQDVRDVTISSLRAHMALVSQEVAIFDDSVRINIAYGSTNASEDEIIDAAKAAAAHDFIMALPHGYNTRLGEKGMKLSGGQRQRIAIARAMLRVAPILLLDEATSSLDTESERAVQAALETLREGRTTLVVAHRLSTVRDADVIYVLDKGKVTEIGRHDELIARRGLYARLHGMLSE